MIDEGRATAVAFFLILLITCVGAYWVVQTVRTSGSLFSFGTEVITPTPLTVAEPTFTPLAQIMPSPTPIFDAPTPAPATPTATQQPVIAATIPPTQQPAERTATSAADATEQAQPTESPTPADTPTPAPSPTPAYLFQVAEQAPDFSQGCNGHYIFGQVNDANGNPLPGVLVHVYDYYGNDFGAKPTKSAPGDEGKYDVPISAERDTWVVEIVDDAGNQLSPQVEVLNTGQFVEGEEACWHRVDFRRTR